MVDGVVDGAVDDNGNGALRSYDLATLSGVLRVCDLEMVLLDGNGPRAVLHSRVHDEALFCSAHCGFHFRGRFMLPQDWCLLGFIHATDEGSSWCHGIPLRAGMAVTVLPEGISEFTLSAGTRLNLMLAPMQRVQRKLTELSLRSTLPSGQALSLFNVDGGAGPSRLLQRYAELHAQLAAPTGMLAADAVDALLHEHVQALLGAGSEDRPSTTRAAHALSDRAARGKLHAAQSASLYLHARNM